MDIVIPKGTYKTEIKEVEVLNPSESGHFGFKLLFQIQKGKFEGVLFEIQYIFDAEKDYFDRTEEEQQSFVRMDLIFKELTGSKLKKLLKIRKFAYEDVADAWENSDIQHHLELLQGKTQKVAFVNEISFGRDLDAGTVNFLEDFIIDKPSIPWGCLLWSFIIAVIAILYIIGSNS